MFNQSYIFLPTPEHLTLLDVLGVMILLIHLVYIALLIGPLAISLLFQFINLIEPNLLLRRMARDLAHLIPNRIFLMVMLGFVPSLTLLLVYAEWFYQAQIRIFNYFGFTLIMASIGYIFIYIHNRQIVKEGDNISVPVFITGLIAISSFKLAYFVFLNSTALFLSPEHWNLLKSPVPVIFSWYAMVRFMIFMVISLAMTGLGILFYRFVWQDPPEDPDYARKLKLFGTGLALCASLVLPILLIWNMVIMPVLSFSAGVFILQILALIGLLIIVSLLVGILLNSEIKIRSTPFILFIIVLFFLLSSDQIAKGNVNWAHKQVLLDKAELRTIELEDIRGANAKIEPDPVFGAEVYKNKCSSCHAFDKKVVGPPHDLVLPKYQNDRDTLKKFIKNPWKVDSNYPSMPAQALNRKELESVIAFMYQELEKEKKTK